MTILLLNSNKYTYEHHGFSVYPSFKSNENARNSTLRLLRVMDPVFVGHHHTFIHN